MNNRDTLEKMVSDLNINKSLKKVWINLQIAEELEFEKSFEGNFSTNSWKPATELKVLTTKYLMTNRFQKVLDVGCGGLVFPTYITYNKHNQYFGIDPYSNNIKKNLLYQQAIAEKLPFDDNFFDYIFLVSVLDHSMKPKQVLSEAQRVLVPGGRVFSIETVRKFDRRFIKWKIRSFNGFRGALYNSHHMQAFTRKSLLKMFQGYFSVEYCEFSKFNDSELISICIKN